MIAVCLGFEFWVGFNAFWRRLIVLCYVSLLVGLLMLLIVLMF